jgi:glycosyltransferase involved in cell wall biosynthesis
VENSIYGLMRDPKSLALFMPSLDGGGAERMMVNLANAFVQRGVKVDLVLVRAEGAYQDQVADDVQVIDLQAGRILAGFPKLVRYLQGHRPEAMLSTLTFANVVAAWACWWVRNPPRLVLRESNTVSAISSQASGLKYRLIPYLIRWFYPVADQVITVSRAAGDDLVETTGLSIDLVTTVYNPVVTDKLFEQAQEPLDHPWFDEGGPPVILGVGRLEPQKDFETLLRAFNRVQDEHDARLVILGEGGERQRLEELADSLELENKVDMPGFVDNPFKYMSRADVFALTSRFEGLPGVLIQAMATGCPVVSTDCPSGPHEILKGGELGDLVPVGNEEAVASAIEKKITGNHSNHGEEKESTSRFERGNIAEEYYKVLINVQHS